MNLKAIHRIAAQLAGRPFGELEGIVDGRLHGWATDPRSQAGPARVELTTEDGNRQLVAADVFRADLAGLAATGGYVGFSVPLHRLKGPTVVRSFAGAEKRELRNSPMVLDRQAFRPRGFLEGIFNNRINGWAFDPMTPARRIPITLVSDSGHRISMRADVYRTDLYAAGYGDGHVGFSVPLNWLRGTVSVRAYAGDDGLEINGSPANVHSPAQGCREQVVESLHFGLDPKPASGLSVSGWICDRSDPSRRCRVALRRRGQTLAETKATLFRNDFSIPETDQLHGFHLAVDGSAFRSKGRIDLIETETGIGLATLGR